MPENKIDITRKYNRKILKIKNAIKNCYQCKGIFDISFNKPKVFVGGSSPKVMLVGHSPAVRVSEKAEVVLKMNQPNRQLYKYIETQIVKPLGISIEDLYCTNLIKCYTDNLPEETNKTNKMYINNICNNCINLLEKEVAEINPKLIISLSGRVLEILSERYMDSKLKIQECFGKVYTLNIRNKKIPYIPVVHIPKYNKIKEYYFPEQTNRLKAQRQILDSISD